MKRRVLLGSLAAAVLWVAPAQALMVAGWDFSQYSGDGSLSLDGLVLVDPNILGANYSNLDKTNRFGAGPSSAVFGTMYADGRFGSSSVTPDASGTEAWVVTQGANLASNNAAPALVLDPATGVGLSIEFDAFEVLKDGGQIFANFQSMRASQPVSVVFQADLSSVSQVGSDWNISFGGKTFFGTSVVSLDFSTDGVSFAPVGSITLQEGEAAFSVDLSPVASETGFVRFNFDPVFPDWPIIDNVAINATATVVPEPGTALLLLTGLSGLVVAGRRRA